MEDWKPGDIAICINNGTLPNTGEGIIPALRLNSQYVVNKVRICECGCITLDVGIASPNPNKGVTCACGAISAPTGIHWAISKRFVKPKTDEAKSEAEKSVEKQLEAAVEAGDQDQVDRLLDNLNK